MKIHNHFLQCGLIAYHYDPLGSSLIVLHFLLAGILPPLETFVLERVVFYAENVPMAAIWIGILIAALVISLLNRHLLEYGTMRLTQILSLDFEGDYAEKLHSLPFSHFENPDIYDAISRFSTPARSTVEAYISLLRLSSYLVTLCSYLALFGATSPWSILVITVLFAISMYFSLRETKKLRQLQLKQTVEERKANYLGKLFTTREALKEMKLFDFSDFILSQHQVMTGGVLCQRLKITKKGFYQGICSQILNVVFLSGGIAFLAWLAFMGRVGLSQVVALATALPTLCTYASWRMPMVLAEIKQKTQVFEDYDLVVSSPGVPSGIEVASAEPVIRFDNVFFTYPGTEKLVLKGFSATISPGENTAIVGVNGCGKSTLIKLILGLYTPDQGEITVGGIQVKNLKEEEKARLFSAVFQDFSIYQMSIRNNITLEEDKTSGENPELDQAISYASLRQTINELSEGLDSEIGQLSAEGIQLSGGESQKIAIARGLYARGQYLILDEPTAALDPNTECRMYEEFCKIFRLRSCIVISHRLATAKIADRILLIHDGQLAESGTHGELMNLNGRYAEMFRSQAQWYQNIATVDEQEVL